MKRYIFGIIAVVVAIGAAAFNDPKKPVVDMYVFEYDPAASGGYAEADVEDISNANWKYIGKNLPLCENRDERACRVAVLAAYVDVPALPTALNGVFIDATQSGTTAHVNTISGTSSQRSNKRD